MAGLLRALAAAVVLTSVISTSGHHAAASSSICIQDVGTRTPVLLVHGFNSTTHTWDAADHSGDGLLASNRQIATDTFAYGNDPSSDQKYSTLWATDSHLGPALADKIACLSSASIAGGGNGKVIVIAHSLGGLALRCAVSYDCNGHQSGIDSDVGVAVTFGTPHLGSFLRYDDVRLRADEKVLGDLVNVVCAAIDDVTLHKIAKLNSICSSVNGLATSPDRQAFEPGSAQQRSLPQFPKDSFPVVAVAGKIRLTESFGTLWHHTVNDNVGDLVVGDASALAESRRVDGIGGTVTVDCGTVDLSKSAQLLTKIDEPHLKLAGYALIADDALAGLTCWHGEEARDPAFLAVAIRTIRQWQHANPVPTQAPTPTSGSTAAAPTQGAGVTSADLNAESTCAQVLEATDAERRALIRVIYSHLTVTFGDEEQTTTTFVQVLNFNCPERQSETVANLLYNLGYYGY